MLANLRVQLTCWFVVLVMLVYLGDSICALFLMDYQLKTAIYQDLTRQSQEIAAAVQIVDGKPTLSKWAEMERRLNLKPDATVQIYDRDKHLLERYGPRGVPQLQAGLIGHSVYSTYTNVASNGYVQVQVPSRQHDDRIYDFEFGKLIRGVLIAFAIGVCGWLYSDKAIEPVVRSLRTLRTFVADAGHELRTPVALIEGSLETLEAELTEHGISSDVLAIMSRASERLKNLSTNMLLLARMENPELELRKSQLDAKEIIGNVVADLADQAGHRHIGLAIKALPSAAIFGDKDSIARLFSNVIENAIRYTPEGGSITVDGWKQDTCICVSIEDNGIGIPPESLPHIFDRFYRVEKARSREAGGSGLGLAIVKAIVDAHGGEITVESQVGKGSKFLISLPLMSNKVALAG